MGDIGHEGSGTPPLYGHSLPGQPETTWELLAPHLVAVGDLAAQFAGRFGASEAARLAGYLHDIGKASREFQRYIKDDGKSPDHSTAGAIVADGLFADGADRLIARLVALAIAGHHAGLADGRDLGERLGREVPAYAGWRTLGLELPPSILPKLAGGSGASNGYRLGFLGRMIFSCLLDADFIATERFYAAADGRAVARGGHAPLTELRERLDRYLATVIAGRSGALSATRAAILAHARAKAPLTPGLFTMTVPTGGGKTLAGLAFALDHAIAHGLDRVIVVAPYSAIIEQTAQVFRTALADDDGEAPDVLEHTGTVDWDARERDSRDEGARDAQAKLRRSSENWDVPVVVTTAVQFFESLHADRPSRCRKLHNLAGSVIVLDEAQTLPVSLLRPCMAAIDELAAGYRASVVLCTATQPALTTDAGFPRQHGGLEIPPDRELAPDPQGLYDKLKRVTVHRAGTVSDSELAARFAQRDAMLCIVNSRKHAQALFALIRDLPGARHLTTMMCAGHRRVVLAAIRADLAAKRPTRLVSTSLVEAGVDIDFPEVWRAETGLDSIAQSAGRANREGRLADAPVTIFTSADHATPRMFRQQVDAMDAALRQYPHDPLGLDAIRAYFNNLYWTKGIDRLDAARLDGRDYAILPAFAESFAAGGPRPAPPYASVARAFEMIDETGRAVIVPWRGDADPQEIDRLVAAIAAAPVPPRAQLRRLQNYTVSVPERAYLAMVAAGAVQPIAPDRYGDRFMLVQDVGLYADDTGLSLDPFGMSAEAGIF
ncbi:CRISPR-associated endonuclease Cas3'' [Sphingomonas adhaesiva]|uniref:CRISPR-associated endonuclease Cas3'' n=1 Tax=Sphingomonas adhaesiva TaxID=28212 RepID=UPI0035C6DAC8